MDTVFSVRFLMVVGISLVCIGAAEAKEKHTIRNITYTFTLENTTNKLVKKVLFHTYAPIDTSYQKRTKLSASRKYKIIKDDLGNTILRFSFDNVAPFQKIVVRIKAQVRLANSPTASNNGKADKRFAQAEKYIESDDGDIVKLGTSLATPKKIFNWVNGSVANTGYSPYNKGAVHTLKNRKGDCTEFATIFTALCRAAGIPARVIGGYVCDKDTLLVPRNYHNWAEYNQNKTWRIADPQQNVFDKNYNEYVAMSVLGESKSSPMNGANRFKVEGKGMKARMN